MRTILLFSLALHSHFVFGQTETVYHKGQFQVEVSFSLIPVRITSSKVNFKYVDGNTNSTYLPDTIVAVYDLKNKYFGNAINVGCGYFLTNNLKITISLKPQLNSFLSNKSKNGKVYGVQFDLGLDYFYNLSKDLYLSFGTNASGISGGYGITSGGAKNKEYLVVNGNALYDNDIGFHIIDNSWAFGPQVGLHYAAQKNFIITANSGYQMTFGRKGRLNIAGLQKDGTVKWNRKEFSDDDVDLSINNSKITGKNINQLPYKFSGLFFELGMIVNLH